MARTWNFEGTLKENGVRVVSNATATSETVSSNEKASVQVKSEDGVVQFQFKIPQGIQGIQGIQGPPATLNLSVDENENILYFS